MSELTIEPGLLSTFRFLTGSRLVLTLLALLTQPSEPAQGSVPSYPIFAMVENTILMVYLSSSWLRRLLGKFYLPGAFLIGTVGPILSQTLTIWARMDQGYTGQVAFGDNAFLFFTLMIPMVLLSSQYSLKTLIAYCIASDVFQLVLAIPAARIGGPALKLTSDQVVINTIIYMLVGYVIVRLMSAQRAYRRELAQANAKLAEYAKTLEQLAISRERNRMARELHDTLAHTLSAVAIQLEALDTLWDSDPQATRKTLSVSRDLARSGLLETRRALQSLRASPLEDLGLALAIRHLAETCAVRAGLQLSLDISTEIGQLPPFAEQSLYRIAEEALNNTVRHANARHLEVSLKHTLRRMTLLIVDDGLGFDAQQPATEGHYGLVGMRERAVLCNSVLQIESVPGQGTKVRLIIEEMP
jgi:signal transduction histidine kinase